MIFDTTPGYGLQINLPALVDEQPVLQGMALDNSKPLAAHHGGRLQQDHEYYADENSYQSNNSLISSSPLQTISSQ